MPQSHPTISCSSRKTCRDCCPSTYNSSSPSMSCVRQAIPANCISELKLLKESRGKKVSMRISFQSMYAYPSHWEHFPMLNTYRVSTFQIFNRIYIYIYVCIDYALLHFDSLPATRTKSSSLSLSLSLALSPLLSRLILRKECSRITQTDRCSEK